MSGKPIPEAWMTPGGDVSRSFYWCLERCLPGQQPRPLFAAQQQGQAVEPYAYMQDCSLEGVTYLKSRGQPAVFSCMTVKDELHTFPLYTAPPPSVPEGVEEMQRRLDREESDHGRTIDQRDAAEEALGRMFQAVTGRVAEWSSAWGYVDAIEEVEEHVAALAQQPAAVDEAMTRRIMREFHANDPGDVWPPDEQGRLRRKALQDAINNALATQHQEPKS